MWDECSYNGRDREMIIMGETVMGPRCNRELAKATERTIYQTCRTVSRLVRYGKLRVLYERENLKECSWFVNDGWYGPPQLDREAFLRRRGFWDDYAETYDYKHNPYRRGG